MLNNRGQALLEITIASGLAMLVITAITITTIIGLRNSQFAQNQLQATKYAQEGLELVQTIQAQNCPVVIDTTPYYWFDTSPMVWGSNQSTVTSISNYIPQLGSSCQLKNSTSLEPIQTKFQRQIKLLPVTNPTNLQKIQVSSIVSWTDYSGTHQSQLVTILSNE